VRRCALCPCYPVADRSSLLWKWPEPWRVDRDAEEFTQAERVSLASIEEEPQRAGSRSRATRCAPGCERAGGGRRRPTGIARVRDLEFALAVDEGLLAPAALFRYGVSVSGPVDGCAAA